MSELAESLHGGNHSRNNVIPFGDRLLDLLDHFSSEFLESLEQLPVVAEVYPQPLGIAPIRVFYILYQRLRQVGEVDFEFSIRLRGDCL